MLLLVLLQHLLQVVKLLSQHLLEQLLLLQVILHPLAVSQLQQLMITMEIINQKEQFLSLLSLEQVQH
jgi:hypothetical protein